MVDMPLMKKMNVLDYIFITCGSILFIIGCLMEFSWFQKRKWLKLTGEVIDFKVVNDAYYPIVEYVFQGTDKIFCSEYSYNGEIGSTVNLLVAPDSGEAVIYSLSSRIFPLYFFIAFLVFFIGILEF